MYKKISLVVSLVVLASMALTACGPTATQGPVAPEVQTVIVGGTPQTIVVTAPPVVVQPTNPPVTRENVLHLNTGPGDIPTIDPNLGTDTTSIQVVDELTIGLTKLHETTLQLQPGMAQSWDVSADGLVYTFHILQGVPWVRWNGTEVAQVLDCDGNVRTVSAKDFEYSIKRAGAPATASDYAYVLYVIAGYADYNTGAITDSNTVGVKATDDATLVVTFTSPAVYNLNIIGLWTAHAVPSWVIDGSDCAEAAGDRWTEPGFNQAYGPYVLKEWVHDALMTIVKNPFWPGIDSAPVAQIDEIRWQMGLDESAAMAEYEAGNLDVTGVPSPDLERVKADPVLSKEFVVAPVGCTYYYGFNTSKPPVDNVHMRRALSMAVDRQGLIDNVLKGGQLPAQWFCNPGSAACPTMDKYPDLGVKSDPEGAKTELQAYMTDMGFTSLDQVPEVILMYNTSEGHKRIAEAIGAMWQETLGIKITVTNHEWAVYLKTVKGPDAPAVWRMGWCLDYPDANNWTF